MPAPIILQDQSGLAQGLATAGSAFAQAMQQRNLQKQEDVRQQKALQQQQQYGSILNQALGDLGQNPSAIGVTQALMGALEQGVPPEMVQKYGSLYAALEKSQKQGLMGPEDVSQMGQLFQQFGMGEEEAMRNAQLYGQLTTGGQTEMAKLLVDRISRGGFEQAQQPGMGMQPQEEVIEEVGFKWPKVNVFEDRTPKERASLKTELLKENNKELKEINTSLNTSNNNLLRYQQLERLNNSGQLPTNLEALNINWSTGDIRFPRLANPATQQYVKTVMDFMSGAKDTFGARVTNFEIGTFLKRLPTLANSEEGRRVIIEQMKTIEELNQLRDQSIKDVYDHYGNQKIDRATADRIAEDYRSDAEAELKKKFANSVQAQEVYEAKSLAPEGKVAARSPSGEIVYIYQSKADVAQKKGYEIL